MPVPLLSGLMSLVRRMSLPRPFTTTTPPPPPHNVNVGAVCAAWDGRSMGEPLHNIEVGGRGEEGAARTYQIHKPFVGTNCRAYRLLNSATFLRCRNRNLFSPLANSPSIMFESKKVNIWTCNHYTTSKFNHSQILTVTIPDFPNSNISNRHMPNCVSRSSNLNHAPGGEGDGGRRERRGHKSCL